LAGTPTATEETQYIIAGTGQLRTAKDATLNQAFHEIYTS
jgi:hypothetical protein